MRINKLSIVSGLLLGGVLACSNIATAQDQKPGGGRRGPSVEQRMERMNEELKLTDEQKPKVKAVLEASQKERQELFTDSSVAREDRREKMRGIMEKETKKLKEILTEEQFKNYEKMIEQMRGRGKGGKKAGEEKKD